MKTRQVKAIYKQDKKAQEIERRKARKQARGKAWVIAG